jgi:sulfur carrier protein ThiS
VKMHPLLVKRAASKQAEREVAHRPGLTALTLLLDEGFSALDAEAVMVVRNGVQADPETAVEDGDRIEFMVGIQGG